jgi:hypothetical protein
MNKKILATSIIIIVLINLASAQKTATMSATTLKSLIGCWQGTLNYSGTMIRKPFTTTSELIIRQLGRSNKFEFVNAYTKDAHDNKSDTITISSNGRKLNNDAIKSKRNTGDGNMEIVTEALGFDHDNNKKAMIRQTYTIGKQLYSYKKQVQPEGQADWLDREEFTYTRVACKNEKQGFTNEK